jgi:hypothetical protein
MQRQATSLLLRHFVLPLKPNPGLNGAPSFGVFEQRLGGPRALEGEGWQVNHKHVYRLYMDCR